MYIVVTNKNPNAKLPKWIEESNSGVLSTKIIWKFSTAAEAHEAVDVFHDNEFEYVHRTFSY